MTIIQKKVFLRAVFTLFLAFPGIMLASSSATFIDLAQRYEKSRFNFYPEEGLFWGLSDIPQDRFMDPSLDALRGWHREEDEILASLNNMHPRQFNNPAIYQSYQLLKNHIQAEQATRICHQELWDVNPMFGWHNMMAMVAEKQPVGSEKNRADALKRWNTFDKIVDAQIARLEAGLVEGFSAPKPAVERVLIQLKTLTNYSTIDSPFYELAKHDDDDVFKQQIANLIEHNINPALQRYTNYLEYHYLSQARAKVGVEAIPNGQQCYQALLKQNTTLDTTPEEIYQLGLEHMEELTDEIITIGQQALDLNTVADIFEQGKNHYFFHSEQDILDYNFAALERAKIAAPEWFNLMPKAEGTIKPYPEHRAMTGAAGEYDPPSEDGTKPGIFYINTYQPETRSRIDQEATLFHELIPGHHFQVALSMEDKSHLSIDKLLWNSGYGEGWALYVERLADEMGLYSDSISQLGMLSNEALRTARLVVDPGMHVMGWTREQAVQYMEQHTALDHTLIQGEVDRYIMMPGQATAYMLGKQEIENLRQLARDTQGERFDIRQFHDQVLKNGAVTLPMLRAQIENWLENDLDGTES